MYVVTLISILFVGVTAGFVIAALMIMAKDRPAEDAGAAAFAFEVLDRIGDWRADSSFDKTVSLERDLIRMCEKAIERAEDHDLEAIT